MQVLASRSDQPQSWARMVSGNSTCLLDLGSLERSVAVRAWAHGWAISRHTQAPIERSGYFEVLVGKPDQITRYILPYLDLELLRSPVCTQAGPGTWLKVCAPTRSVSIALSCIWTIHEPEFLMSANLVGSPISVIEGYQVHTDRVGAIAFARLIAGTGEIVASGQVAIDGSYATFDQIETTENHRRKGLGRCVMTALSNCAVDLGAKQGVLVATEAGAALYKALGWRLVSPVTAASVSGRQK